MKLEDDPYHTGFASFFPSRGVGGWGLDLNGRSHFSKSSLSECIVLRGYPLSCQQFVGGGGQVFLFLFSRVAMVDVKKKWINLSPPIWLIGLKQLRFYPLYVNLP